MYRLARVKSKTATAVDTSLVRGIGSAEDGFAVAMVLVIIMIVSLLGIAMLTVAAYQMRDADRTLPSNRAFDLADSGLSYAHGQLAQENPVPDPPSYYDSLPVQMGSADSTFDVTITKDTDSGGNVIPYHYRIVSTGSYRKYEGSASNPRTYTRKLEEVVQFRTAESSFDVFTYCMYSDKGDVILDTGTTANASTGTLTVDGNIYAGRNVNLLDEKTNHAAGSLTVTGNVTAGQDVVMQAQSGYNSTANDSVTGDLTARYDVSILAQTAVGGGGKGASWLVGGSINSGRDVSLISRVFVNAGASVKVAQSANTSVNDTSVNAKGNVYLSSYGFAVAQPVAHVGNSEAASGINADGNVDIIAWSNTANADSQSRVYGNVLAKGHANLTAAAYGPTCAPVAEVRGDMKNNGGSNLSGIGIGSQAIVLGLWQHPAGVCSTSGNYSFDPLKHLDISPGIGNAPVQPVPDIDWPEPDWDWYRTMAIAQGPGHYYTSGQTFTSDVNLNSDPSSMWVMYVEGNVTIQKNVNLTNNGVIVCEGDFTVNGTVAMSAGSKYQVIAKGNITHANSGSINPNANDTVFLYTDGSYDGDNDGISGNVTYDLAWFNTLKGQITAKGNIKASAGDNTKIANPKISYAGPSFPVLGWSLPFEVLSFRELSSSP